MSITDESVKEVCRDDTTLRMSHDNNDVCFMEVRQPLIIRMEVRIQPAKVSAIGIFED